jgi:hypothetical protein
MRLTYIVLFFPAALVSGAARAMPASPEEVLCRQQYLVEGTVIAARPGKCAHEENTKKCIGAADDDRAIRYTIRIDSVIAVAPHLGTDWRAWKVPGEQFAGTVTDFPLPRVVLEARFAQYREKRAEFASMMSRKSDLADYVIGKPFIFGLASESKKGRPVVANIYQTGDRPWIDATLRATLRPHCAERI